MKKLLLLLSLLAISIQSFAYDFVVDGIYYFILTNRVNEVEVTRGNYQLGYLNYSYEGEVTIPSTVVYNGTEYAVTTIGSDAFRDSKVTSVNLPNSIIKIDKRAFYGCQEITFITLPEYLVSIEQDAFALCHNLTEVSFSGSISYLGQNSFSKCSALQKVIVKDLKSWSNAFFYDPASNPLSYAKHLYTDVTTEITGLIIPDDVINISNYAFRNCVNLESVTINNGATRIGKQSFEGCSNLHKVNLTSSLTEIDSKAFNECSNLVIVDSEISEPFAVTGFNNTISSEAILYVPFGTKESYINCSGWSYFKEIIEKAGNCSFKITSKGNGVVSWNDNIIRNDSIEYTVNRGSLINLSFNPDYGHRISTVRVNGTNVTSSVSNNQYTISNINGNITLEVIFEADSPVISFADANVKAICIANWDTNGDGELSEAEAAMVTDIGTVFSDNATITSFDELKYFTGLKSILSNAFKNCYYLKSISIPSSVTSIGNYAFLYCKGLTGTLIIPNSVTSIGSNPFAGCSGLANIIVEDGNQYYDSRNNCNAIIKTSTNSIISGCKNTTIPNSVTSIGFNAFANCSGLTSLDIPNSVTSIESNAFHGCSGLASVTIGNNVTNIGRNPFYGCDLLANVVVEEGNKYYDSRNNCNAIIRTSTNQLVVGCMNTIIPTSVTSIGEEAFRECSGLTGSLIIPTSVTSIGSSAFLDCKGLTGSLTIPNSVTSIGYQAFYRCTGIEVVKSDIEEPFSINDDVFYLSNSKHKTLQVPKGTKSKYQKLSGWTMYFDEVIEETAITTYTLSVKASGNGSAIYDGNEVRGNTQSYTVNEGASAAIIFKPDTGYRIASVKVNGAEVTSSIKENQYTINNITSNTTLAVTFEAITHTLSITASGNGSATYNSTAVRGKTQEFTVNEGTSATITFVPDAGYRIASVKLNGTDVTASVADNKYVINNITANTTLAVTFEAITHTISITSSGNGSAYFNNTTVRNKTEIFTVNEGTSATITFAPDAGYRIASVILNGTDVTASVANNMYTISNITAKTTLSVTFEAIPPTTYSFTIKATGNGTATYNDTSVRGKSSSFIVNEGTSATVKFTPDAGYKVKSVKLNSTDVTASMANSQYTINSISANTTLEVEFEVITHTLSITASGNGSATFDNMAIRGNTQVFTVSEGTSATISFNPDTGYRIASVKLNGTDITSSVSNNKYTISNITENAILTVTFLATTYTLSITASGNGSVTYNGISIRGKTLSFTVNEGTSTTITFIPDTEYRIASVKMNGNDVTASVANNKYTINNISTDITLYIIFEVIPPTTYSLSISASGNGYVAYDGNTVRDKNSLFSVIKGTNAILKFSADDGNRLKSLKVNGQDVIVSIVNNQYTINNITADINVEVVFEAIPTYSLNLVALGNGNAVYNGTTIRNQSQNFTLLEGSSAIISFTPDTNYRIKSVKVNNADVTSQVAGGQITISNIKQDTNVEVTFEEIPPTTYSLTITAIGNGVITYDGNSIRGGSSTFTVVEGSYVTVQIAADDGYRLKRVTYNGNDLTASAVSGQFTTDKITANATLTVEFEAIPTFSLTIKSSAFGCVKYGNAVITNQTVAFTVREGTEAVITFIPDGNGRLQRITLNGNDITGQLVNRQYTISDIRADQSVEAEYVEDITKVTDAGVAYTVTSYDEGTVVVAAGNYGLVLTIPASFTAKGKTWTVIGIDDDALTNATELAAIIWEPEVPFTAQVSNPNLLLYVKRNQYAQSNVQNVVVGDENEGEALMADNIVLTEAESGNNFYCPKAFEAKRISYEHNYSMISGYKTCQGWETLVLPFDVTMTINTKGTELVPYSTWKYGSNLRPFWLYQMTNEGWKAADGIKANVPYIISMPNNEMYESSYNLTGNIQFIGTNVEVKASDNLTTVQYGNKRLVANYQNQAASSDIYALNVSNDWHQNTATEKEGSTFIRSLRSVHPFEAYLTVEGSNAPWAIPVFESLPTGINEKLIVNSEKFATDTDWYTIDGRKLQGEPKQNGIYIIKGKKVRK